MRRLLACLLLLTIPAAVAQDGCTEEASCPWSLDVDDEGFDDNTVGGTYFNGTLGDWHHFEIFNAGDVPHTIRLDAFNLVWEVQPLTTLTTEPFELAQQGRYTLEDEPSGDTAEVNVLLDDVVDQEGRGTSTGEKGSPAPGAALLLLALALLFRRR